MLQIFKKLLDNSKILLNLKDLDSLQINNTSNSNKHHNLEFLKNDKKKFF